MKSMRWVMAGVIVVAIIAMFGIAIWYQISLRAVEKGSSRGISYTFESGRGVDELASDLQQRGVIRSSRAFVWYVTLHGLRGKLQAGSYDLSPSQSASVVAEKISHGSVAVNRLIVPEGKTIAQIRKLAAAKGVSEASFTEALTGAYANNFLGGKPTGVSLEGYLFPDSYTISKSADARLLIQAMLDNFGKKMVSPELTAGLTAQGLNFHQGLTLASIVEREVSKAEDRPMVARLYLNRLKIGMALQADPTAIYGAELMGKKLEPAAAVAFDSPYNTYKIKGLPPGPIGSPGVASLRAVANPGSNDFFYFISGNDGKTYFAKTFAEHQANIDKHLN